MLAFVNFCEESFDIFDKSLFFWELDCVSSILVPSPFVQTTSGVVFQDFEKAKE